MTTTDPELQIATATTSWRLLLQEGVEVEATIGASIREVLTGDLGLTPDYVERRVDAVFLDGHPVDDIDHTRVSEGARLSLAGALPGAAGIAMRRNSPYAALRGGITAAASSGQQRHRGLIHLRLFGLVLHEAGASLLQRRVYVEARRLVEALRDDPAASASFDGVPASGSAAMSRLAERPDDRVGLTVTLRGRND